MELKKRKRISYLLIFLALFLAISVLKFSAEDFLRSNLGCPCFDFEKASGEFSFGEENAYFAGKKIEPLSSPLAQTAFFDQGVLGESSEEKWVEIDLSDQKLRAWEGSSLFIESLVSSGKWGRTPTGEFRIWGKFKYAKMSGGSRALHTYYYLPNVPYIMYFSNSEVAAGRGFSLHGTYWHDNFGQPMSHGCVNLPTPIAERLFYWTQPLISLGQNATRTASNSLGTKIVIHD